MRLASVAAMIGQRGRFAVHRRQAVVRQHLARRAVLDRGDETLPLPAGHGNRLALMGEGGVGRQHDGRVLADFRLGFLPARRRGGRVQKNALPHGGRHLGEVGLLLAGTFVEQLIQLLRVVSGGALLLHALLLFFGQLGHGGRLGGRRGLAGLGPCGHCHAASHHAGQGQRQVSHQFHGRNLRNKGEGQG